MTDDSRLETSGIAHARELIALAEAMVSDDDEALSAARERALEVLGAEATLDAVAVASNFERMVRIADSTGIPLDTPLEVVSQDLREDLDLARFGSSANTEVSGSFRRALGRLLQPIAMVTLRGLGLFRRARARRSAGTS